MARKAGMKRFKSKVLTILVILCFLFSEFVGLVNFRLNNDNKGIKTIGESPFKECEPNSEPYLFLKNVTQSKYVFSARGECYI